MSSPPDGDIAALAKGGRTNFLGFLLRLAARLPFLFIAGRLYGPEALGRFASALVVVELAAMVCSLGEKRGLAQRLTDSTEPPAHLVADGLVAALLLSLVPALFLWLVPAPMFPNGTSSPLDRLLVLAIPAFALTEILLAAQAYRFDVATTVRARAVVEPWTISIMAGALWFVAPRAGLALAYLASIYAGLLVAGLAWARTYGLPRDWRPAPRRMTRLAWRAAPLAAADAVEWGTRRLDIFILGNFAQPAAVGVYYIAQQVASLPQKLKTSFEPVLGPVIARNLKESNHRAIAAQVRQVGFWIIAAQAGIALALGIPGEAVMGLLGPQFVGGTGALALLLAAEVAAAPAVVAEAALVYMARKRNLLLSLATIGLQAVLTIVLIEAVRRAGYGEPFKAAAAAGALFLTLGTASIVKSALLARLLGDRVNSWRPSLLLAAAAALAVGAVIIRLPEWLELAAGVPALLATYGWVIWRVGFGPEDRMLFRRQVRAGTGEADSEAASAPAPPPGSPR